MKSQICTENNVGVLQVLRWLEIDSLCCSVQTVANMVMFDETEPKFIGQYNLRIHK